jgi:integrase/recombinase XerD
MKLKKIITEYLAFKHSMGISFYTEKCIFSSFCRYVGDVQMCDITPKQIRSYLDGNKPATSYWERKHTAISGLYRFALSRNYVDTLPLPRYHPKIQPSLIPYIYSKGELKRLLDNTPAICGRQVPMEAFVFRTLLLLLYGACLRHGEALRLTISDVDLNEGVLHVRETKFYKTRLVPLGKDLHKALNLYKRRRNKIYCNNATSPFFCFKNGQTLSQSAVRNSFRRLRILANVKRNDKAIYQPRLHDLRHTGVVHRLIAWYRSEVDLDRLLPQLSTYLGHTNLEATQHYLTLTTELLSEASLRFERFAMEKKND